MLLISIYFGIVVGLIAALVLNLTYHRLSGAKQLYVFMATLFVSLLPSVLLGLIDMHASNARNYVQADMSASTGYIVGLICTCLGFGLVYLMKSAPENCFAV